MFVDFAKVFVKSGKGGDGVVSFRREAHVPKGGPSGGDGGKGGSIIIKADNNLNTLQDIKYHKSYKAKNGGAGSGARKTGQNAEDVIIPVPVGTVVFDEETKIVLADLTENNQTEKIAKGGKGGKGNSNFATPSNRAPRYSIKGKPGEAKNLVFELKIFSDVGLVGLPNAGKSTLISAITAAKPKIADYPFTTLVPNLGIVKFGEFKSFVLADIPGLIEGAHLGKGLGIRFLRHLERTKVLAFLIDCTDPNPLETYNLLKSELENYLENFKNRPRLIVFTKSDLAEEIPKLNIENVEEITISSATRSGLETFVQKIVKLLEGKSEKELWLEDFHKEK